MSTRHDHTHPRAHTRALRRQVDDALNALRTSPSTARRDPRVITLVRALRAPRDTVRMCTGNPPHTTKEHT
ncbi:MAG: hypothetical protein Q4C85_07370 [Actinomyces sp.]|uniref:hypothetical protein n=1 Tax=Actinomyces sp. TaxID=29317 RepID=UPI0026DBEE90|nr:hypothetical protein [Actinomyces sp.]MDO4243563.1 hypothetical protein [Actinomyces sp.]